ncbi:U-scoloptoxin(01)-Cw1a-like [Centruroides vittatus]|uniref:U-scoloptoxin(01)-Cw1a-like n=1 Tax=Centruroides vittatus TaxID=120091 RepID=UPI003510454F
MKYIFAIIVLATVAIALPRMKRQAYVLPDGVELIVGSIQTSFKCDGLRLGFYADQANGCKIFHVCNPVVHADGTEETQHYSFYCGNQTVFDQLSLTCSTQDEAVSCDRAKDFFYVNDKIGDPKALFLTEDDVLRARKI